MLFAPQPRRDVLRRVFCVHSLVPQRAVTCYGRSFVYGVTPQQDVTCAFCAYRLRHSGVVTCYGERFVCIPLAPQRGSKVLQQASCMYCACATAGVTRCGKCFEYVDCAIAGRDVLRLAFCVFCVHHSGAVTCYGERMVFMPPVPQRAVTCYGSRFVYCACATTEP